MYACDIHQYLVRQNVFCTISPNITLTNISSYTVCITNKYKIGRKNLKVNALTCIFRRNL